METSPDVFEVETRVEIFRDTHSLKLKKTDLNTAKLATIFKV